MSQARSRRTRSQWFTLLALTALAPGACGGISLESAPSPPDVAPAASVAPNDAASDPGEPGAGGAIQIGPSASRGGGSSAASAGTPSTPPSSPTSTPSPRPASSSGCGGTRTDPEWPGILICTGNGIAHRVQALACPESAGSGSSAAGAAGMSNDDAGGGEGGAGSIGCSSDADCPANSLCLCGFGRNTCMPANCRTDADCGAGSWCADLQLACTSSTPAFAWPKAVYGDVSFACQSQADECQDRSDCPQYAGSNHHWLCAWDGTHRRCVNEELSSCF